MVYDNNRKKSKSSKCIRINNSRYSDVNTDSKFYIARDEEQFLSEVNLCFNHQKSENSIDAIYSNIGGDTVVNTFRYIFEKFKKGIYVKIRNNKLDLFLPFSNIYYRNEWSDRINFSNTNSHESVEKWLIEEYYSFTNYNFSKDKDSTNISEWYANNCLLRFDKTGGYISDRDTNIPALYDMLQCVCDECNVPDVEFFLNKRDFPLLKKDLTEPYNHIWDSKIKPLVSHKYEKYCPIISMSKTDAFCDLLFPTYEDWNRVKLVNDLKFSDNVKDNQIIHWDSKIEKAIFRGALTGSGISSNSENNVLYNPRLKARIMSKKYPDYLDAGIISKSNLKQWNRRPRKLEGFSKLQVPKEGKIIKNFANIINEKYKNQSEVVPKEEMDLYLRNNNITINLDEYENLEYITIENLINLYKQNPDNFVIIDNTIDSKAIVEDDIVDFVTFSDQCKYKYILHIEGHTAAQRLSLELSSGSVILFVESEWSLWYSNMIKGFNIENFDSSLSIDSIDCHYIKVNRNLDNLINVINKCRENDAICKKIASNAKEFYTEHLSDKKYLVKYIKNVLEYVYTTSNISSVPCKLITDIQLDFVEKQQLTYKYPKSGNFDFSVKTNLLKYTNSIQSLSALNWVFDKFAAEDGKNLFKFDNTNYDKVICINKLGIIYKYNFNNVTLVLKETNLGFGNKHKEHIHDSFIGTKCINNLLEYCPNFTYTFGCYALEKKFPNILNNQHLMNKANTKLGINYKDLKQNKLTYITVNKYINGQTFSDYLYNAKNEKNFNFNNYISIMFQIFLSLEIAQRKCAFVHNDLMPWNIMIKKETNFKNFAYVIGRKTYQIKTKIIPYMIDFGKSNAIHDDIKYGIGINTYKNKINRFNDIFMLMSSTLNIVLDSNINNLKTLDKENLIQFCNFICNTDFKRDKFNSIIEIVDFFKSYKKYSILAYSNKLDLQDKSPIDYINYIIDSKLLFDNTNSNIKYNETKNLKIKVLDNFSDNLNIHKDICNLDIQVNYKKNELLIYNEIVNSFNKNATIDDEYKILLNFLKKIINISAIKNNNILTKYYCAQVLLTNYILTNNKLLNLIKYFDTSKYANEKKYLDELWQNFMSNLEYIKNYSLNNINIDKEIPISKIEYNYPAYTEYTFLNINSVYDLLSNYRLEFNNNLNYKNKIMKTLLFKHSTLTNLNSKYNSNAYIVNCEFPADIRSKFKSKLSEIIDIDSIKNIELSSWSKTLYYGASKMYANENMLKIDNEILNKKHKENVCKIIQLLDNQIVHLP